MGLLEWFSGRNGIYRDSDKVDQAKTDLTNIKSNEINAAKEAVSQALDKINACTGFEERVGHINTQVFDESIDYSGLCIDEVISQIDAKVNDINEYDKGDFWTKAGATAGMVFSKVGEGFLGAFEDVGDAAVVTGAWICNIPKLWTGKDTAASTALQDFAKKDLSHEAFEWYYNSDLAKYSAFTEDSGCASICRGAGQAAGYLTMGGYLAGANNALAGAGKLGKAAQVLKSTTNANTLLAAVGGFGSGTEAGLQKGYGLEKSSLIGVKEAAIQGAVAYGAGKIGEAQASKAMQSGGMSADAAKAAAKEMGGYYDALTTAAQSRGASDMANILSHTAGKTGLSAVGGFLTATGQNALSFAMDTAQTGANAVGAVASKVFHPVQTAKEIAGAVLHPAQTLKAVGNAATTAVKLAAAAPGTTVNVAANMLKDPVGDAVAATGIPGLSTEFGLGLSENRAASQFATKGKAEESMEQRVKGEKGTETGTESSGEQGTERPTEKSTEQTTSGDDSGYDGGYDGGGSDSGSSQEQFTQSQTETPTEAHSEITTEVVTTESATEAPTQAPTDAPTEAPTSQQIVTPTEAQTEAPVVTTSPPAGGDNPTQAQDVAASDGGGATHTGGGYTADGGYTGDTQAFSEDETSDLLPLDDALSGVSSIDEIIKGGKYTKIPTSTKPITTTSGGSSVIPIAAGLSAAAAAGIGAKAYMDHKRNSENEDDDDYDSDDWGDEENIDISYDDDKEQEGFLSDEDDYGYQDQKYGARSSEELADLQ